MVVDTRRDVEVSVRVVPSGSYEASTLPVATWLLDTQPLNLAELIAFEKQTERIALRP